MPSLTPRAMLGPTANGTSCDAENKPIRLDFGKRPVLWYLHCIGINWRRSAQSAFIPDITILLYVGAGNGRH